MQYKATLKATEQRSFGLVSFATFQPVTNSINQKFKIMENKLVYAVNCDCDCMLGLNYTFKEVVNWFESDEAKESYAEDFDEVTLKMLAIEHLSKLLQEYKNGKLLSDVLDLSWNEI